MSRNKDPKLSLKTVYRYAVAGFVFWTLLNVISLWWTISKEKDKTLELAVNTVRSNFNKDMAFRQWAAQHGGLYVPITESTQPNPYLTYIEERDIETPSGKKLTLMNPAWMMRQVMTQYSELYPIKGRITSLKTLNPLNTPDEWETKALKSFEEGTKEVTELSDIDGEPYMRYMRPLPVKQECLKCHAFQGYQVGEVRGGMGVSVSLSPFLAIERESTRALIFTHGMFWNLGVAMILVLTFRSRRRLQELIAKETNLREIKENLAEAQRIAHFGSFEWNVVTNELFWSDEVFRIYRYSKHHKPVPEDQFRCIHADDRERVKKEYNLAVAGVSPLKSEYRIVPEGETCHIKTEGELVKDEQGKPLKLIGFVHDITEQKKSEIALQNSEMKFRSVTETASDAIVSFNEHGEISFWNNGATNIFGYTESEAVGKLIGMLIDESERKKLSEVLQWFEEHHSASKGKKVQVLGRDKKGNTIDLELSISQWKSSNERFFTGIIRDITEQRNYENDLMEAKEAAEAANKTKSRFLSTMSHELRTPLNGVLGMTELTLLTDLDHIQKEYIETIAHSGEALLQIINQILDISKVEANIVELEKQDFNLIDTIKNNIRLFSSSANMKKLKLVYQIDDNIISELNGDSSRLSQILSNLIANGIKFTEKGSVAIHVHQIGETKEDVTFRFEVADTGVGIPEDKQVDIFKSFTQVDSSTTRRYGGAGLGLAIVSNLVRLMNGTCGVESEEENGSTFWFILSFDKQSESHPTITHTSESPQTGNKKLKADIKVLLVEDDRLNQTVIEKMITLLGYQIDILPNGKAALEILPNYQYDIILMDCLMPVMDGYEATRNIRRMESEGQLKNRTPIVALTAKAMKGDKEQCLEAGMDDFLSKPVTIEELKQTIDRFFA